MKTKLKVTFFVVSILLGVSLCVIGALLPAGPVAVMLLSLGSATLGSVVSLLFSALSQSDVVDAIYAQLGDHAGLLSDEDAIRPLRKKIHHYHLTQIEGMKVWRYRVHDFGASHVKGRLQTTTTAEDGHGRARQYVIDAGVRESRLILFDKALDSREPVIVEVFPTMLLAAENRHAGIGFMQTWDGNQVVTPCLYSDDPIDGIDGEGTVDESKAADLMEAWGKALRNQQELFILAESAS